MFLNRSNCKCCRTDDHGEVPKSDRPRSASYNEHSSLQISLNPNDVVDSTMNQSQKTMAGKMLLLASVVSLLKITLPSPRPYVWCHPLPLPSPCPSICSATTSVPSITYQYPSRPHHDVTSDAEALGCHKKRIVHANAIIVRSPNVLISQSRHTLSDFRFGRFDEQEPNFNKTRNHMFPRAHSCQAGGGRIERRDGVVWQSEDAGFQGQTT